MTARLRIDRTRCAGHGICVLFVPGMLDLDAWGFPELQAEVVDPGDLRRAARAVNACPRQALAMEELPPPARPLRAPWEA